MSTVRKDLLKHLTESSLNEGYYPLKGSAEEISKEAKKAAAVVNTLHTDLNKLRAALKGLSAKAEVTADVMKDIDTYSLRTDAQMVAKFKALQSSFASETMAKLNSTVDAASKALAEAYGDLVRAEKDFEHIASQSHS